MRGICVKTVGRVAAAILALGATLAVGATVVGGASAQAGHGNHQTVADNQGPRSTDG